MDERTRELIHGELDGENGPAEHEELERRLAGSAEARGELEGLRKLKSLLEDLPDAAPPAEIGQAVMSRIRGGPRPADRPRLVSGNRPRRASWIGMAAAMAATITGIALILGRTPDLPQLDPSVLSGTMGRPAGPGSRLTLSEGPVSGSILLHRSSAGLALEVDLDAERPVEVTAGSEGAQLELRGFVRVDGMPARMASVDGQIHVVHNGNQHYALVMSSRGATASALDVAVYEDGNLVGQGRLRIPEAVGR